MSTITTAGTTTPTAIFSCATWLFGVFSGRKEEVVVASDTALDSDEDPVGCEKSEEKDECEEDDEDAGGGDIVCGMMGQFTLIFPAHQ